MFRLIAVTTFVMSLALAQASVPKGATEVEPGVWKHTDTAGKTFVYRKTPFGVVKSDPSKDAAQQAKQADSPKQQAPAAASTTASPFGKVKAGSDQKIKVVERGDSLEFERPSPFGSYKWKAKKSELTAEEQEAWSKTQAQQVSTKATGPKE
jgi:hypothetical protein